MTLKDRLQQALKRESGVRLSAAEVQAVANALGLGLPAAMQQTKNRRRPEAKPAGAIKGEPLPVHIRWMIRSDMVRVLNIEAEGFGEPWSEEDFIRCLRQRNCIGMVAEHDDRVIGFMIYELHKSRLQILNFAVANDVRLRTVGTQMMQKLSGKLSPDRRQRIVLEIWQANYGGQMFLASLGFKCIESIEGFYEDGQDAYRFELPCNGVPYQKYQRAEPKRQEWRDSYADMDDEGDCLL